MTNELEIVQVFEGDPDFYRLNFDYENKILTAKACLNK